MFTDGPDEEAEIIMAAQMNNDELREAIKYAHDMAHNLGTAHPLFATMHGHLIQLLEIQRSRAAACSVDNSNPTEQRAGHLVEGTQHPLVGCPDDLTKNGQ